METTNKILKNLVSVTGGYPVYEVKEYIKKELSDKDCYFLRDILMRFVFENKSSIWQFMDRDPEKDKQLYYEVDNSASISDDALYMGDFEGYDIAEDTIIRSIELTTENRVILNVYNTKKDSHKDYVIY